MLIRESTLDKTKFSWLPKFSKKISTPFSLFINIRDRRVSIHHKQMLPDIRNKWS